MMLLLNRKTNESVTAWFKERKDSPLVIRVAEISPTGTVTLGFDGDTHTVCRTEIFYGYGENEDRQYQESG